MRILGIDPGNTGALALIDGDRLLWAIDAPVVDKTIAVPLLDQLYGLDIPGMAHGVDRPPRGGHARPERHPLDADAPVAIEAVHSMPGQGVTSMFTFGKAYGLMLGYFGANGHRIHHVTPQEWKRTHRLIGKDKDAARALAIETWPHMADLFARKKDVGRADAALIALHTHRTIYTQRQDAA